MKKLMFFFKASKKHFFLNFSQILGVQKHFCLIKVKDGSKSYSPESKVIVDIPTALAFFGDLTSTKTIVGEYIHKICNQWNSDYVDKPQVR